MRNARGHIRALSVCVAGLLTLTGALVTASQSDGSTATVVVTATVPSSTSLDTTNCASNSAATNFGVVLPDSSATTTADCRIIFGSSNDTAMLLVHQTVSNVDAGDPSTAMARTTTGTLDSDFGTDGTVLTDIDGSGKTDAIGTVQIQPDGKIIAGGGTYAPSSTSNFAIARYTVAGDLDPSFGTGGETITDFGAGSYDTANASIVQPDGKTVLVGLSTVAGSNDFALARYATDGTLDPSFGSGGKVLTDIGTDSSDPALAAALQSDGKIVAAGETNASGDDDFAVVRYNPDGSLDTSFSGDGKVVTNFAGSSTDTAFAVAMQPDNKIVVAGTTNAGSSQDVGITRYNADGSLDTTFGTGGKVVTDVDANSVDTVRAMTVRPNGDILVAGYTDGAGTNDFMVLQYRADGTLDPAFGSGGKTITDVHNAGGDDHATCIAIQPDGKIVVAGHSILAGNDDFALVRYDSDGSVDPTFGTNGSVTTEIGSGSTDVASGIAVTADGGILLGGTSNANEPNGDFAMVRYGGTRVPDYAAGTSDWTTSGTSMFAACLRDVATGAATDTSTWTVDPAGTCTPGTDGVWWNAIPTSDASSSAKVATSPTSGSQTAEADLVFGFRTRANQPSGLYEAPITFDVAAPNV